MQRRRLTWTPELAEKYWRMSNLFDLAAAKPARRQARHLAFCVAMRFPAPAKVLVVGDRDLSYCEALLALGYDVARLDLGAEPRPAGAVRSGMIRKLASGRYRLYSRKTDPKTGKRRNLGTFDSKEAARQHEREVQYFKRH